MLVLSDKPVFYTREQLTNQASQPVCVTTAVATSKRNLKVKKKKKKKIVSKCNYMG